MFDPDRLYTTDDPAMRMLAPASTLAQWRYEKRGPAYMKYGKRIMYSGKDLNAFLTAHRIEPPNAA